MLTKDDLEDLANGRYTKSDAAFIEVSDEELMDINHMVRVRFAQRDKCGIGEHELAFGLTVSGIMMRCCKHCHCVYVDPK